MNALIFVSSLLVVGAHGNAVIPRAGALSTLKIPIPTQARPFTSTVAACGTVPAFEVIGVPTGTFTPGTFTVYLPPQASPTGTTITDSSLNATEVLTCIPLQGDCAEFPFPAEETPTAPGGTPTPTPASCPEKGCSAKVIQGAQTVISLINKVTLISQNLQAAAKLIGGPGSVKRDTEAALAPADVLVKGLRDITFTLSISFPRISVLSPLPPGCDSDTVVIALIQFVRVHQALLNILIGRAGLLETGPIRRDNAMNIDLFERGNAMEAGPIGGLVAGALRGVEGVVDTLAFTLIKLIPTRSQCAKEQKDAIDRSLTEAIIAYE